MVLRNYAYTNLTRITIDNYLHEETIFSLMADNISILERQTLLAAVDDGIIDMNDVRRKLDMKERTKILEQHKYAITQGKDGNWRTYLPDPTKRNNRRLIKKATKNKLEDCVIDWYKKQDKKEILTLEALYPEWLQYYSLHTKADGTVKRVTSDWKRYYINDPIIKQSLSDFSKLQLDKWVHGMIKRHSMTKTNYYNMSLIIRQMMLYAKESKYISYNPFEEVKVNSKMFHKSKKKDSETQVYTLEEEIAIIEKAWEDFQKKPEVTTPLAVILMFYFGVRIGEIVALKDVDIEQDHIEINRMERREFKTLNGVEYEQKGRVVVEHTKTSAGNRKLYVVKDAKAILDKIIEVNKKRGAVHDYYLFMNHGARIFDSAVRWRVEKYCRQAGIPYKSPHKIRKTYISKLIDDDVNINTIRELVGHVDERTTYKSYCYSRKTKDQTQNQLEEVLAIQKKYDFTEKVIPFTAKDDSKKVVKGNQNITA